MDWEAIGAVGEILGALGVIASLLYLALQINQSNKVTRATTYHEITKDVREAQQFQANSPDYASIMSKADEKGVESLTQEELNRWSGFVVTWLVVFENCFHSDRERIAHDELWPSARRGLKNMLRNNRSYREWFELSDSLTSSFREEVSKICVEIDAEAGE